MLLRIAMSNIFCDISFGFDIHFKYSFLFLVSLASILFLKFSIVLLFIVFLCSLICTMLFHLCHHFSASNLVCVLIRHMVLAIVFDGILIHNGFFSFNPSLKVFIMKHILFFIKKVRHKSFNITNRNIIKISNRLLIIRQPFSFGRYFMWSER